MAARAGPEDRGPRSGGAGRAILFAVAIAILAIGPFAASARYGFVDLDDNINFQWDEASGAGNPYFHAARHTVDGAAWRWLWAGEHLGHWQPLAWLSLYFDTWRTERFDPRDFHRTNLALHALNSVLVFFLARALLARRAGGSAWTLDLAAAGAALLWAVHPLRVESVAWITERRELLSTAGLLGAALAYVHAVRRAQASLFAVALALYAVSLLSTAWGITFPVVLLVLDVELGRPAREPWGRLLAEKLWFLPLAVGCAAYTAHSHGEAVMTLAEHSVLARAAQASYGLVFYLLKSVAPLGLSPLYLLEPGFDPTQPIYLASIAAVALLALAAFAARARFPAAVRALAAYAILVSPVLGLFQSGAQKVADRYTYLAAIPLSIAVVALLLNCARARRVLLVAGAVALLALGSLAARQTRFWSDSHALFARMVAVEPDNYFAQHCLAVILQRQGRLAEAIEAERRSIAAHPNKGNEPARHNLGLLLRATGRHREALEAFRGALEVGPDFAPPLWELVRANLASGDVQGAIALCEATLARAPSARPPYEALARLHAARGDVAQVEATWQRALAQTGEWPEALHGLGLLELEQGRPVEAEHHLVRAVSLDPKNAELRVNLGRAYQAQGRLHEASQCYAQALQVAPDHARAHALLQEVGNP